MEFLHQLMNPTIEQWHEYSPIIGVIVLSLLGLILLKLVCGAPDDVEHNQ